ncbi:MAG: hypothetical protein AAFP79_06490 [Pseudomonadota bacterium]
MKQAVKVALRASAAIALLTPAMAQADIIVGPRVAYYYDNSNLRTSNQQGFGETEVVDQDELARQIEALLPNPLPVTVLSTEASSAILADQIGIPMFGATVNFGDDRDRFTITGMYGEGDGRSQLVGTASTRLIVGFQDVNDLEISNIVGQTDVERIDIESTWQRRLNENFAITAGLRYERLNSLNTGTLFLETTQQIVAVITGDTNQLGTTPPTRFDLRGEVTQETFTARVGGTAFVPLDQSINVFFSGMAQFGYSPSATLNTRIEQLTSPIPLPELPVTETSSRAASEISVGPDMAVGVQWIIMDNLALDVRYRAVVFFPLTGDFDFDDAQVNHGVNLGLSLRL